MNELTSEPITVVVRRLRTDDEDAVRRFFGGLSALSLYRRFHSPVTRVPAPYLDRLFATPQDDDVVVVAVEVDARCAPVGHGEPVIVGVAELLRSSRFSLDPAWGPTVRSFDLAFVVADDRRRHGVGRRLVREALGLDVGADVIRADVQSDNAPALRLLRDLLPAGHVHVDTGALVFEAETHPERHALGLGLAS